MRAMGACRKLRMADRDYGVGFGGGTESSGRREVGEGLFGSRGRGKDVCGVESGLKKTGGENREEGCRAGWFGVLC